MTYSRTQDGLNWTDLKMTEAGVRTNTASSDPAVWSAAGYYLDVDDDYPPDTPPRCQLGSLPGDEPELVGDEAVWPVHVAANCSDRVRASYTAQIRGQVPIVDYTEGTVDPAVQADIVRTSAAANDKLLELDETADANLDDFDPTLDVKSPQDDTTGYSRLAASMIELDPWAGAPSNIYGWAVELEVIGDDPGIGSEARWLILDDPSTDSGGVLPFVQDGTNPAIWRFESRDGGKWPSDTATITGQLLWGGGSLPITDPISVRGVYDRQPRTVRYGVTV